MWLLFYGNNAIFGYIPTFLNKIKIKKQDRWNDFVQLIRCSEWRERWWDSTEILAWGEWYLFLINPISASNSSTRDCWRALERHIRKISVIKLPLLINIIMTPWWDKKNPFTAFLRISSNDDNDNCGRDTGPHVVCCLTYLLGLYPPCPCYRIYKHTLFKIMLQH